MRKQSASVGQLCVGRLPGPAAELPETVVASGSAGGYCLGFRGLGHTGLGLQAGLELGLQGSYGNYSGASLYGTVQVNCKHKRSTFIQAQVKKASGSVIGYGFFFLNSWFD